MTGVEKAKKKTAMRPDPIADAKVNRKSRPWVIAASARSRRRAQTTRQRTSVPCAMPAAICPVHRGVRRAQRLPFAASCLQ
jgi:hypothetical protein